MQKTIFRISKMDCPSEERMIRMKLESSGNVKSLDFDLPNRTLKVIHSGEHNEILSNLESLKLDAQFMSTETVDSYSSDPAAQRESKILWQVLLINLFFFAVEMAAGFVADSMGLVADSLDMLADSIVYGLSLYVVGGHLQRKKNIARASGYFQLFLAVLGFIEVLRRFMGAESLPAFQTMIIVSVFALIGNAVCLYLLQKSKSREAHMQASIIFTSNDVIANLGVIAAGVLVLATHSKVPDLIAGVIIFALVARGAFRILQLSK